MQILQSWRLLSWLPGEPKTIQIPDNKIRDFYINQANNPDSVSNFKISRKGSLFWGVTTTSPLTIEEKIKDGVGVKPLGNGNLSLTNRTTGKMKIIVSHTDEHDMPKASSTSSHSNAAMTSRNSLSTKMDLSIYYNMSLDQLRSQERALISALSKGQNRGRRNILNSMLKTVQGQIAIKQKAGVDAITVENGLVRFADYPQKTFSKELVIGVIDELKTRITRHHEPFYFLFNFEFKGHNVIDNVTNILYSLTAHAPDEFNLKRAFERSTLVERWEFNNSKIPELVQWLEGKKEYIQKLGDAAMNTATRGGIDFNRAQMQMNIHKEGQGVQMQFDLALIARIKREGFDGLDFKIQSILPVSNLPLLLGLKEYEISSI